MKVGIGIEFLTLGYSMDTWPAFKKWLAARERSLHISCQQPRINISMGMDARNYTEYFFENR